MNRDGISGMLKVAQTNPFVRGATETNARDLIPELHALIHPTESHFGIAGTRGTYHLSHQVQVIYHGRMRAQEFVQCGAKEWLAEHLNGLLNGAHRIVIAALQSATHTTVMG